MKCIFCKIVEKKIPSKIIYEDKYTCAFLDTNPASNGHTLVIPKKHYLNFSDCDSSTLGKVMNTVYKVTKIIKKSLKPKGFNYLSNEGYISGQRVMHFHFHIIPKYHESEGIIVSNNNKTRLKNIDSIFKQLKKNDL
jgi:histidine triad (HIT) family protein